MYIVYPTQKDALVRERRDEVKRLEFNMGRQVWEEDSRIFCVHVYLQVKTVRVGYSARKKP